MKSITIVGASPFLEKVKDKLTNPLICINKTLKDFPSAEYFIYTDSGNAKLYKLFYKNQIVVTQKQNKYEVENILKAKSYILYEPVDKIEKCLIRLAGSHNTATFAIGLAYSLGYEEVILAGIDGDFEKGYYNGDLPKYCQDESVNAMRYWINEYSKVIKITNLNVESKMKG